MKVTNTDLRRPTTYLTFAPAVSGLHGRIQKRFGERPLGPFVAATVSLVPKVATAVPVAPRETLVVSHDGRPPKMRVAPPTDAAWTQYNRYPCGFDATLGANLLIFSASPVVNRLLVFDTTQSFRMICVVSMR